MKKLYNLKDLKSKYEPDKVISAIEENFVIHKFKIISLLSIDSCPLSKYKQERQMSFLESDGPDDEELVKEVANTLHDAIYFMTLSKKKRTSVTQKMRSFAIDLIDSQLGRIKLFSEDMLLELPFSTKKDVEKPQILNEVIDVLGCIESGLEIEKSYWENIPRAGYLSGLQVSMGKFFVKLNQIGMSQKDQITLVQQILDEFKVDWQEGARENIKVSLQLPSLEILNHRKMHFDNIMGAEQVTSLSKNIVAGLTSTFNIYRSQLRRF